MNNELEDLNTEFPIRIQVRNVRGLTSESILRIYFENVKMSGGGPIESLKWQPEFNVAIIKFERHPEEEESK